jgi:hypothetical protein
VVLPSGRLEAVGVLLLSFTSLLWLGDASMMSSALLNVAGWVTSLLQAISVGVALIRLGEVKLDHLMA